MVWYLITVTNCPMLPLSTDVQSLYVFGLENGSAAFYKCPIGMMALSSSGDVIFTDETMFTCIVDENHASWEGLQTTCVGILNAIKFTCKYKSCIV